MNDLPKVAATSASVGPPTGENRSPEADGDLSTDDRTYARSKATRACQRLDAHAFIVGNHVAFNDGEYDPGSPEGQHVIAHELAHVRQQTGGQLSMLPQEDLADAELAVDPDPQLEREAERAAQDAMSDGPVTVNPMGTEVHVQRSPDGGRKHPDDVHMLAAYAREAGSKINPFSDEDGETFSFDGTEAGAQAGLRGLSVLAGAGAAAGLTALTGGTAAAPAAALATGAASQAVMSTGMGVKSENDEFEPNEEVISTLAEQVAAELKEGDYGIVNSEDGNPGRG